MARRKSMNDGIVDRVTTQVVVMHDNNSIITCDFTYGGKISEWCVTAMIPVNEYQITIFDFDVMDCARTISVDLLHVAGQVQQGKQRMSN
jgi:hypothetical protein